MRVSGSIPFPGTKFAEAVNQIGQTDKRIGESVNAIAETVNLSGHARWVRGHALQALSVQIDSVAARPGAGNTEPSLITRTVVAAQMTDSSLPADGGEVPIDLDPAEELRTRRRGAWRRANDTKDELLGMKFGTACHQLRKLIMFDLVCKLDLNVCFRCSKPIDSVEELSIEHKSSWQRSNDPKATFFDLNNISFSHRSCNQIAGSTGRSAPHGVGKYRLGCRCEVCVTAKRAFNAQWMANWRAAGKDKSRINFKGP
ncbi:hypothetical protein [Bradyrhizobium elkanii]|uniref:hypothetical protein n=1 Tax=Bradyrhizobium elkanii TaxID=29448 RepID=UPI000F74272E|nr:hypothetical protein [Bradyrhizobium elkanii]NWL67308.1 hypothetical protein [Bradyrhizobium elkanii]